MVVLTHPDSIASYVNPVQVIEIRCAEASSTFLFEQVHQ